ncbi:MAG: hypothetical protein Q8L48_22195 [Archangium sp.]|nr:hypothetical protein [Archangium sp.]
MEYAAYGLVLAAIPVMAVNVVRALRLSRRLVGGEIGQTWAMLTGLVGLFFVGYLISPAAIFFKLPVEYLNLRVFSVFLFGAVFVSVVISIVGETLGFLKLLK